MDDVKAADECSAVSDSGLKCQKKLYWFASVQEYGDHTGGHMFASDEVWNRLTSPDVHIDNTALLSGLPAASHEAKDCTRTGYCAWRTDSDF